MAGKDVSLNSLFGFGGSNAAAPAPAIPRTKGKAPRQGKAPAPTATGKRDDEEERRRQEAAQAQGGEDNVIDQIIAGGSQAEEPSALQQAVGDVTGQAAEPSALQGAVSNVTGQTGTDQRSAAAGNAERAKAAYDQAETTRRQLADQVLFLEDNLYDPTYGALYDEKQLDDLREQLHAATEQADKLGAISNEAQQTLDSLDDANWFLEQYANSGDIAGIYTKLGSDIKLLEIKRDNLQYQLEHPFDSTGRLQYSDSDYIKGLETELEGVTREIKTLERRQKTAQALLPSDKNNEEAQREGRRVIDEYVQTKRNDPDGADIMAQILGGYQGGDLAESEIPGKMQEGAEILRDSSWFLPTDEWTDAQKSTFYSLAYHSGKDAAADYGAAINKALEDAKFQDATATARALGSGELSGKAEDAFADAYERYLGGYVSGDLADQGAATGRATNLDRANAGIAASVATAPGHVASWADKVTKAALRGGHEIGRGEGAWTTDQINAYVKGTAQRLNEDYGTIAVDEARGPGVLTGKGLGDFYQLAISTAQSLAYGNLAGEAVTLGVFFGQAADHAYDRAIANGASTEQATLFSFGSGLAEVIGEKVSLDHLLKGPASGELAEIGKYVLKQAGIEGGEEVVTAFLERYGDKVSAELTKNQSLLEREIANYVAGGMSYEEASKTATKRFLDDVMFEFIGGFLSGGLSSSVQSMPYIAIDTAAPAAESGPAATTAQVETQEQQAPAAQETQEQTRTAEIDAKIAEINEQMLQTEKEQAAEQDPERAKELAGHWLDLSSELLALQDEKARLEGTETTPTQPAAPAAEGEVQNPVMDVIQTGEVQTEAETEAAPGASETADEIDALRTWLDGIQQRGPNGELMDSDGNVVSEAEYMEQAARLEEIEAQAEEEARQAAQPTEGIPAPATAQESAPAAPAALNQAEAQTDTERPAPFTNPEGLNTKSRVREGRFSSNTVAKVEERAGIPAEQRHKFEYKTKGEGTSVMEAAARLEADRSGEIEKLRAAEAWSGVQADMARQIGNELYKAGELDAYAEWLQVMHDHANEGGRGIQAYAKDSRAKTGQSAFDAVTEAVNNNETMSAEDKSKLLRDAKEAADKYDKVVEEVAKERRERRGDKELAKVRATSKEGGEAVARYQGAEAEARDAAKNAKGSEKVTAPESLLNLIQDVAKKRKTSTFIPGNLGRLLKAQSSDVDYLLNIAHKQIVEMGNDSTVKRSFADKVKTTQSIVQLIALTTFKRNIAGNVTFGNFIDVFAKDAFGVAVDKALSNFTGKRTVGFDRSFFSNAARKGGIDAAQKAALEIALDVGGESKYGRAGGRSFKMSGGPLEQFMSRLEQLLSYELNASDQTSKGMIRAENERGLRAIEDNGLTEDEIQRIGEREANYRTFHNKDMAYKVSKGVHDLFNLAGFGGEVRTAGREGGFGLGDIVNPYYGIPANLGVKPLEYSPLNILKGGKQIVDAIHAAKEGNLDGQAQYDAVMNVARGMSGIPIITLCAALAKAGIVKNWDSEEDKDAKALNTAEGKSGLQINLDAAGRYLSGGSAEWQDGDDVDSIGFLSPANAFLRIGGMIADSDEDEDPTLGTYAKKYAAGTVQSFLDIPMMNGISNMVDTYNYADEDEPGGKLGQAAMNYAGNAAISFVPVALRNTAAALDPYTRDTTGANLSERLGNSFLRTIPGSIGRESLPTALDNFGNPRDNGGDLGDRLLNYLVNPGSRTTLNQSDVGSFVFQLRDETGDVGVIPDRKAPNVMDFGAGNESLTPDEKRQWQEVYGQSAQRYVREMMEDDLFAVLDPDEQAAVIKGLYSTAKQEAGDAVMAGRGVEGGQSDYASLLAGKYDPGTGEEKRPPLKPENMGEYIAFDTAARGAIKSGDYDRLNELFGFFDSMDENTQAVLAAKGGDIGQLATLLTGTEKPNPQDNIPALAPEHIGQWTQYTGDLSAATANRDFDVIDELLGQFDSLPRNMQKVLKAKNPDELGHLLELAGEGVGSGSWYAYKDGQSEAQRELQKSSNSGGDVKMLGIARADIPEEDKAKLMESDAVGVSKNRKAAWSVLSDLAGYTVQDAYDWFEDADWSYDTKTQDYKSDEILGPLEVAAAISRMPISEEKKSEMFDAFYAKLHGNGNPTYDKWVDKRGRPYTYASEMSYMKRTGYQYGRAGVNPAPANPAAGKIGGTGTTGKTGSSKKGTASSKDRRK